MKGFGAEFPLIQKLQSALLPGEEVGARLEPLYRMHDQVKVVELHTGRLQEVSAKTSRGGVENRRELSLCNRSRPIECAGRAAAQNHLLNHVLGLFVFSHSLEPT